MCLILRFSHSECALGRFPASPSQMRSKKVQLMEQRIYDQECNVSNQVWGWGMIAMTLQRILHDRCL